MRIAIDARELAGRPTGVGRIVAELLAAWNEMPGAAAHEFVLCAPERVEIARAGALRLSCVTAPGHGTLWEQLVLPRLLKSAKADVLFAPGYTAPLWSRVPTVLAVHDVSFAAHPEWYTLREGTRRRVLTRMSARRAARVITISDFSKREIVKHLGVDQSKVEVIYLGTTSFGEGRLKPAATTDGSPTRGPAILYVGSIFRRRHVPELIEAFARLSRRHPEARLKIVGDNRTTPRIDIEALAAAVGPQVRVRSYISEAELAALHADASAFAFLSDYEGFGLTPLEALASGLPIVVLDTEVAREVYGPAAIYVSSADPAAIEQALERALFDPTERARVLDTAPQVLERYSWHECAHRTLQVLLSCAA